MSDLLTIHEIPSPRCWRISDPTAVHGFSLEMQLTDFQPGEGTLTIRHDGEAWTHYWGAMGSGTIAQFLARSEVHYVATKLAPQLKHTLVDWDRARDVIRQKLSEASTDESYTPSDLRHDLYELDRLDDHELQGDSGYELIGRAFGHFDVECWDLPKIPNPEYQLLERLVSLCIAACKELSK